ncbi:MAG: helix-turn-helix domain-containing protein [Oscillospiraceae bacterium]|jgi:repressor LexA|nr:helix-turn-helix domain-containing protein [Oscillospiraceae bacterium]
MYYLRELRAKKCVSQQTIADYLGITNQAYSNYENGKREADYETQLKLAEYFGVPLDALFRGAATSGRTYRVPILGTVAAGLPIAAQQDIEGHTYTTLNGGAEYFALRVKGDSMDRAHIPNGCLVIVRQQERVENGEIAVVIVGEENGTVKRYKQEGDTVQLVPVSFNLDHETQVHKAGDVRVVGLVKQIQIEP